MLFPVGPLEVLALRRMRTMGGNTCVLIRWRIAVLNHT